MMKYSAALLCFILAGAPALVLLRAQNEPAPLAEQVFKNVQVLKGIPADEFMSTMGIFSAALGMSCEDCHASGGRSWEDYALDTSPRKRMTRTMVGMMASINRTYFGGRQVVTCYTCHRAGNRPQVTPNLATLYDRPFEPEDAIEQAAAGLTAEEILDRYLQALGGVQQLASITSFVARGTARGYGPESDPRPVEIYARAPAQRTTIIHTLNGDNITVFDGRSAWVAAPLRPVAVMPITGQALAGMRFEAQLSFPGQIKQALGQWRSGYPVSIGDRDMHVVQGTAPGGALVTLYFDAETGLLARQVRYADSPVGRIPTQIDYSDYRQVAGVKMPFRWTLAWLDGKEDFTLSEIQVNVAIEASRFARPSPAPAR